MIHSQLDGNSPITSIERTKDNVSDERIDYESLQNMFFELEKLLKEEVQHQLRLWFPGCIY